MKNGDGVKQIVHPIKGVISRKQYDESSDGFIYQVDYTDVNGDASHRWFTESEIEIDPGYVAPLVATPIAEVAEGGV